MKKTPEYQKVTAYLEQAVLSGELSPGSRLPAERELAARLGTGRYTVREGLRVLENQGLIESRPGSGSYLTGNPCRSIPSALHFLLLSRQLTQRQISQVRRALEQEACCLAIPRLTAKDAETLRSLSLRMQAEPEQTAALDFAFHQEIFRIAANPLLIQLMDALSLVCREQIDALWQGIRGGNRNRLLAAHTEIQRALTARDGSRCRLAVGGHYDEMERLFSGSV